MRASVMSWLLLMMTTLILMLCACGKKWSGSGKTNAFAIDAVTGAEYPRYFDGEANLKVDRGQVALDFESTGNTGAWDIGCKGEGAKTDLGLRVDNAKCTFKWEANKTCYPAFKAKELVMEKTLDKFATYLVLDLGASDPDKCSPSQEDSSGKPLKAVKYVAHFEMKDFVEK